MAGYYFLDAITAVIAGFIYTINPYLPLAICLLVTMISTFLVTKLYEIPINSDVQKDDSLTVNKELKLYFKKTISGFKFILKSPRLRSLILFSGLFVSILSIMNTLRTGLLNDVNVSPEATGTILALMGIISCYSASRALNIHNKYHNRTLAHLGLSHSISLIVCGAVVLLNFPKFLTYYLLLIGISIQYISKGPYYALIKQYLNSFCNSDMRLKIYSANALIESILRTVISFFCSFILTFLTNAEATLVLGILSTITTLLVLSYMSTRVGLKPEEYTEKDIAL